MSNLYEELIWRFATTKHKASKEFLTPRDIVRLATKSQDLLGSLSVLIPPKEEQFEIARHCRNLSEK